MLNAIRTPGGHPLLHVVSALQKAIRRSNTDDALYWAVQMHLAGYHEYCWKRLKIICSEDIGPAAPYLPAQIEALHNTYTELQKKSDGRHEPWRLMFVHAVILLCQAPKSRICDHALMVYFNSEISTNKTCGNGKATVEPDIPPASRYATALAAGKIKEGQPLKLGGWRPIPDYCVDKHSPEGRRKGRGWEHFFDVASKLVNQDGTEPDSDPYRVEARRIMLEIEEKFGLDGAQAGERSAVESVSRKSPKKASKNGEFVFEELSEDEIFGF